MKITDIYAQKKPTISFEFFPPKTEDGEVKLFEVLSELKALRPSFVSVTYGAMGTTRGNTLKIVTRIKQSIGLEAVAHLTCVAHSRTEIDRILGDLSAAGVENVMALRGDIPKGEIEFEPIPDGFRYASELVRFIRSHPQYTKKFALAVAGYPEGHVECRDKALDMENLKWKVDQGADAVITQLFFENRFYFEFVERARKAGIQVPIVPGIMPVTHGPQIQKFASMCGVHIPKDLDETIRRFGDDQASVEKFGIEFATRQCQELLASGVPGIHFYTLNKSAATRQICRSLQY